MKKRYALTILTIMMLALSSCGIREETTIGSLAPMTDITAPDSSETSTAGSEWISAKGDDGILPEKGSVGHISFQLGGSEEYSEYADRGYYVFDDEDGYLCLICQGEHNTGGYSIRLTDIQINADGALKLIVEETSPEPGACVTEAFTYPACYLSLSEIPEHLIVQSTNGAEFACLGTGYTVETTEPQEMPAITNAKSILEYAPYMTQTSQYLKYSECPDDSDLAFYFDLFHDTEYLIVTKDQTDYLLFLYSYRDYGARIGKIKSIAKSYDNGTLSLHMDKTVKKIYRSGDVAPDGPDISFARCILKLDEPVNSISLDGMTLSPYAGGQVYVDHLWGAVDADLNIVLPIAYEGIHKLDTYGDDVPTMYRIWNDEGTGLVDEQYHEIIPVKYSFIDYVSPDRYVVTTCTNGWSSSKLSIIDGNENLIYGSVDGMLSGNYYFQNHARQAVFKIVRDPEPPLYGIVDEKLNIILPAEYDDIDMFGEDTELQFYVVEKGKDHYAVFNTNGKQMTEFQYSSVYDAQTAYFDHLQNGAYNK